MIGYHQNRRMLLHVSLDTSSSAQCFLFPLLQLLENDFGYWGLLVFLSSLLYGKYADQSLQIIHVFLQVITCKQQVYFFDQSQNCSDLILPHSLLKRVEVLNVYCYMQMNLCFLLLIQNFPSLFLSTALAAGISISCLISIL